jgi:glycosyl transferase family 25
MHAFLETTATHSMICEDDITFGNGLEDVLDDALAQATHWNILRLSGLSSKWRISVAKINGPYSLCVNIGRLKGAGAYVVDRIAAKTMTAKLVPMWLPYDHAMDREFVHGLRAISVRPFPVSQTDRQFRSLVQHRSGKRLNRAYRWLATYPYQAGNEIWRWVARSDAILRFWRGSAPRQEVTESFKTFPPVSE